MNGMTARAGPTWLRVPYWEAFLPKANMETSPPALMVKLEAQCLHWPYFHGEILFLLDSCPAFSSAVVSSPIYLSCSSIHFFPTVTLDPCEDLLQLSIFYVWFWPSASTTVLQSTRCTLGLSKHCLIRMLDLQALGSNNQKPSCDSYNVTEAAFILRSNVFWTSSSQGSCKTSWQNQALSPLPWTQRPPPWASAPWPGSLWERTDLQGQGTVLIVPLLLMTMAQSP